MRPGRVLTVCALVAVSACGTHNRRAPVSGEHSRTITAAEIEEISARDAWEVLRRKGTHLSLAETRSGQPGRASYRGRSSILLNDAPLLVVDGIRMVDLMYLRSIPAQSIVTIRIMTGIEGTRSHGTGASGGVIDIRTRNGPAD